MPSISSTCCWDIAGAMRADDLFRNNYPDDISAGTRKVPAKSDDWSNPYKMVFWANRIIEHAPEHGTTASQIDRFVAEAYFFRAYAYYQLVCKFGGVPILVNTAGDIDDPILYGPRASREEVMTRIYTDLNLAARELPLPSALADGEFGRISRTAARGLSRRALRSMKARVGNSMAKSRPSPISRLPMKLPTR